MNLSPDLQSDKARDDALIKAYETGYRAGIAAAVLAIEKGPGAKVLDWWRRRRAHERRQVIEQMTTTGNTN